MFAMHVCVSLRLKQTGQPREVGLHHKINKSVESFGPDICWNANRHGDELCQEWHKFKTGLDVCASLLVPRQTIERNHRASEDCDRYPGNSCLVQCLPRSHGESSCNKSQRFRISPFSGKNADETRVKLCAAQKATHRMPAATRSSVKGTASCSVSVVGCSCIRNFATFPLGAARTN